MGSIRIFYCSFPYSCREDEEVPETWNLDTLGEIVDCDVEPDIRSKVIL